MDKQKLVDALQERIKAINTKFRPLTNCYSMSVLDLASEVWSVGESFIFSFEDHGVNRLVYFAANEDALGELLKLPIGGVYFLEFMTRNEHDHEIVLAEAGYTLHARMMRMINPDCRALGDVILLGNGDAGTIAGACDTHEINEFLWSVFHTEISHLLTDEELTVEVEKGHTRIHRDLSGKIDALLQADVMPKKFYINQVVNKGNRINIHSMLQSELEAYIAKGGKYLYAWVEDKNIASVKFHAKYGMKHDGMWSMIYRLER